MEQTISSKDTSISTLNRSYKDMVGKYEKGTIILDYGCGKYNVNKNFAETNGFEWHGIDPFNRSENHNAKEIVYFTDKTPNVIFCNNVLNVINSMTEIENVVSNIHRLAGNNTDVYFTIYEGNKSGIPKITSKGFQRNLKTVSYVKLINKYFDTTKKGNIIYGRIKHEESNE